MNTIETVFFSLEGMTIERAIEALTALKQAHPNAVEITLGNNHDGYDRWDDLAIIERPETPEEESNRLEYARQQAEREADLKKQIADAEKKKVEAEIKEAEAVLNKLRKKLVH